MTHPSGDWTGLIAHLGVSHEELEPVRRQAIAHLDQANAYMLTESGGDRLRWTYAGLPELWLQCEVIRERQGVVSSRLFLMSLE